MRDFVRVAILPEEMAEWRAKNPTRPNGPGVYRIRCVYCGKRYWGSGIAIGSHRKACGAMQLGSVLDEYRSNQERR